MALVHSERAVRLSGRTPRRLLSQLIGWLQAWRRVSAERRYLAGLNDDSLRDLGLSRHDVDPDAVSHGQFW